MEAGYYKHYKGKLYKVIGFARHSETLEEMVIYEAMYESADFGFGATWVRPKEMFLEQILHNEKPIYRFEYLGKELP